MTRHKVTLPKTGVYEKDPGGNAYRWSWICPYCLRPGLGLWHHLGATRAMMDHIGNKHNPYHGVVDE